MMKAYKRIRAMEFLIDFLSVPECAARSDVDDVIWIDEMDELAPYVKELRLYV